MFFAIRLEGWSLGRELRGQGKPSPAERLTRQTEDSDAVGPRVRDFWAHCGRWRLPVGSWRPKVSYPNAVLSFRVSLGGQKSRTLVLAPVPDGQKSRTLVLAAAPGGQKSRTLRLF